jgi:hypothetical protein
VTGYCPGNALPSGSRHKAAQAKMFKIFSKRMVDDGLTAQAFFLQKVEEYIKEA